MNEQQWKSELKKYLYLLPAKEEKDILSYYNELFADYYEQGYSEREIILELGDPKEVAKSLVADYLDDNDAIEKKEQKEEKKSSEEKAHDVGVKIKNSFSSAGRHVSAFFDGLILDSRKKKSSLNSEEKSEYEDEINQHRKETKAQQDSAEQAMRDEAPIEKEGGSSKDKYEDKKKKTMEKAYYREIVDDEDYDEDEEYYYEEKEIKPKKKIKRKTYTQAQRHSFLTNLFYVLLMVFLIGLGFSIAGGSGLFVVNTIISTIEYASSPATGAQLIVDAGYITCILGGSLIIFGLALGIIIGCIKKIYKRFFVKKYILLKKHDA